MKTTICIFYGLLLCCPLVSCDKKGTQPIGKTIYFSSFESANDTTGWHGVSEEMFVSDPAPEGGNKSLHICGGCAQPTAFIDLAKQTRGGYYRVNCWGKLADISQIGSISLVADAGTEHRREIHMAISDTVWTSYESEELLCCPSNHPLRLEIMIGGFIPASMFVDCIAVERIR